MFRWKHYLLGSLGLLALALVLAWSSSSRPAGGKPSNPQELEDVIQIAHELGLHCRGDREDGQVQMRLLLSEAPLPWEQVSRLIIGRNEQTDWRGVVAVHRGPTTFPMVAQRMTRWGNFRLYGDPALIRRLTGQ